MTNIEAVLAVLRANGGRASIQTIRDALPSHEPRLIRNTLNNAYRRGLCHFEESRRGINTGPIGEWVMDSDRPAKPIKKSEVQPDPTPARGELGKLGRVSSVWDLGRINAPG